MSERVNASALIYNIVSHNPNIKPGELVKHVYPTHPDGPKRLNVTVNRMRDRGEISGGFGYGSNSGPWVCHKAPLTRRQFSSTSAPAETAPARPAPSATGELPLRKLLIDIGSLSSMLSDLVDDALTELDRLDDDSALASQLRDLIARHGG